MISGVRTMEKISVGWARGEMKRKDASLVTALEDISRRTYVLFFFDSLLPMNAVRFRSTKSPASCQQIVLAVTNTAPPPNCPTRGFEQVAE